MYFIIWGKYAPAQTPSDLRPIFWTYVPMTEFETMLYNTISTVKNDCTAPRSSTLFAPPQRSGRGDFKLKVKVVKYLTHLITLGIGNSCGENTTHRSFYE